MSTKQFLKEIKEFQILKLASQALRSIERNLLCTNHNLSFLFVLQFQYAYQRPLKPFDFSIFPASSSPRSSSQPVAILI